VRGQPLSARSLRLALAVLFAVGRRPDLWVTGVRQALVLAPDGWWRRWPHLPLPDPAYLRFRMITARGGDGTGASGAELARDLVTYLQWCRTRPLESS